MPGNHLANPDLGGAEPLARPILETRQLEVRFDGRRVLGPLDLQVRPGSFLGIVGPNGSGKTTLLRALTGSLRPFEGQVLLEGRPLEQFDAAGIARRIAVVPQQFNLDFSFTVEETVAMGRYIHLPPMGLALRPRRTRPPAQPSDTPPATAGSRPPADPDSRPAGCFDHSTDPVAAALQATGLAPLADRLITQLSGGERQRTVLAQALAQDTPILLLDEPLNNLDLNHQLEVMQLLGRLHEQGRTIVVVLHDLNMAAQYCEEIVLLHEGKEFARGTPSAVLDPATILEVFKVRVVVHRQGRRPYITPLWSRTLDKATQEQATKVHIMAGGGAASQLIEELVHHGFAPTVGIVSVLDTDYSTAERYGLRVVSAPPFEPYPPEAIAELDELVRQAETVIVAPVFFGRGNLALLRTARAAATAGKRVLVITDPPLAQRDLTGGEAQDLVHQLLSAGATEMADPRQVVDHIARQPADR